MNLMNRYVTEVGRHLPEKSRADIEKEIRSTLEDMLEDQSQKADRPVDDEMVVDVLRAFGHPRKVAASYLPERYLIGPQLYPYFMMVVKISLLVAFGIGLIRLSMGIILAGPGIDAIIRSIVEGMLNLGGIAITILGNVTLVFAVMERVLPNLKDIAVEWDPRSLPEDAPVSDHVSIPGLIGKIVFMVAAILIFNFYPQIFGIGFFSQGKWNTIPFLSENFFHYLPWFNAIWILELVQYGLLLRQGRWQPSTRWFSIALEIFRIGLLYALVTGPSIVGLTTENLQAVGVSASSPEFVRLIGACVILGLSIAAIIQSIQVIVAIYKLLTHNRKISSVFTIA